MKHLKKQIQKDFISADISFSLYDDSDSSQQMASCYYAWELITGDTLLRESLTKEFYAEVLKSDLQNGYIFVSDLENWGDDLHFPYTELKELI